MKYLVIDKRILLQMPMPKTLIGESLFENYKKNQLPTTLMSFDDDGR